MSRIAGPLRDRAARPEPEDVLLLSPVLLLPWAFGGVELWAYRTAAALVAGAAAVALVRRGADGLGLDRRARWLVPAALLGVWAAIQIVPLPRAAIALLSPHADAVYRDAFPGWSGGEAPDDVRAALERQALARVPEAAGLPAPEREEVLFEPEIAGRWTGWRTLSLFAPAGAEALPWYVALLLAFLVVRRRCRDPGVARTYRRALYAAFVALAAFGVVYAATSNGRLYWLRPTFESTRPIGPFVNPTNFAAVMELGVPWLAGAAILAWRRARGPGDGRALLLGSVAMLGAIATVASASRAGTALVVGALAVLALAAARTWRARVAVLAGGALCAAAAAALLAPTVLGERVERLVVGALPAGEVDRVVAWRAALPMLADHPVTGIGFGAFGEVFPRYQPAGVTDRYERAHNDWLQLAVEGGVPAVALVAWLAWGFLRRAGARAALRVSGRGLDPRRLGLLLGLLAMTAHALVDFNHQVPADALLFVTLAAIAVTRGETALEAERAERSA